jgi:hypothetical protein
MGWPKGKPRIKQDIPEMTEDNKTVSKRTEEVRTERRRRVDMDEVSSAPLAVNHAYLDHNNYEYRFANDVPGRMQKLYDEDWDKVEDPRVKPDANSEGTAIRKLVGANKDGSPLYAYLLRKPKKMYQEDRARKMAVVKDSEDALKRGQAGNEALSATDPKAYIPDGRKEVVSIQKPKGAQTYEP